MWRSSNHGNVSDSWFKFRMRVYNPMCVAPTMVKWFSRTVPKEQFLNPKWCMDCGSLTWLTYPCVEEIVSLQWLNDVGPIYSSFNFMVYATIFSNVIDEMCQIIILWVSEINNPENKHGAFSQSRFYVGPASLTLAKHESNIDPIKVSFLLCWETRMFDWPTWICRSRCAVHTGIPCDPWSLSPRYYHH